jgi:hypothetical protein
LNVVVDNDGLASADADAADADADAILLLLFALRAVGDLMK